MSPLKIQKLSAENDEALRKLFKGHSEGFLRFGDAGYIMPTSYKDHADALRAMTLRPDDIWVATYPRSGTTFAQEIVWLLNNNLDYQTAKDQTLIHRYRFIEIFSSFNEQKQEVAALTDGSKGEIQKLAETSYEVCKNEPSPRFFKTHLPMSLLPPKLLDTCKVVYVARDPRDVAISCFHHNQLFNFIGYTGDFETYWKLFIADLITYAPFIDHIKEAWNLRDHPNFMFIFYEDLVKDLPSELRKLSAFYGKQYTDEQITKLCDHIHIDNFKLNKSVNPEWLNKSYFINSGSQGFVRKGVSGGWRGYFNEEMQREAEQWMQRHLADCPEILKKWNKS